MNRVSGYLWIENFWTDVIAPRDGRRWEVDSLHDGDLALRDGIAHALVRECLSGRRDVTYRYLRAWADLGNDEPLAADVDLLFIGRPKPFVGSRRGPFAKRLEGRMFGRFIDPNDGQTGNSICYERRVEGQREKRFFARRELEEPFGRYRRCDRDYGILICRRDQVAGVFRTMIAIGGLGTLGTLGLAVILADENRRRLLASEAEALAPLTEHHCPADSIELCVRISVSGDDQLANLLNNLAAEEAAPPFEFALEAVAVATAGGKPDARKADVRFKPADERVPVLEIRADGEGAGRVRLRPDGADVPLGARAFEVLHYVVRQPQQATVEAMCRDLVMGHEGTPTKAEQNRLTKRIWGLNECLKERLGPSGRRDRVVRCRDGRYVLEGVRGVIVEKE